MYLSSKFSLIIFQLNFHNSKPPTVIMAIICHISTKGPKPVVFSKVSRTSSNAAWYTLKTARLFVFDQIKENITACNMVGIIVMAINIKTITVTLLPMAELFIPHAHNNRQVPKPPNKSMNHQAFFCTKSKSQSWQHIATPTKLFAESRD